MFDLYSGSIDAGYASPLVISLAQSADSTANFAVFRSGWTTNTSYGDDEFHFRSNGNGYCDWSWQGGGADYAEYFEWADGNLNGEIRVGYSVVLDGDKIRKATLNDDTTQIIGVVSKASAVIGDTDIGRWKQKYLRDDFGAYILDENGHRTPNPEYDESIEYISREIRQEWDTVGLIGKLRIWKGQPVGDRWIKMRDISDSVEEWLVR